MPARFLADADLDQRIVTGLKRREPGLDFEPATAAALEGMPDVNVLELAALQNRVLVSHDRRTMPIAFYTFLRHNEHPGLILIKQSCAIGVAIDELQICYRVLDAKDFANRIHYLPF